MQEKSRQKDKKVRSELEKDEKIETFKENYFFSESFCRHLESSFGSPAAIFFAKMPRVFSLGVRNFSKKIRFLKTSFPQQIHPLDT